MLLQMECLLGKTPHQQKLLLECLPEVRMFSARREFLHDQCSRLPKLERRAGLAGQPKL